VKHNNTYSTQFRKFSTQLSLLISDLSRIKRHKEIMNLKVFPILAALTSSSNAIDKNIQKISIPLNAPFFDLDAAVHTQWTDSIQRVKSLEDSCPEPAPFFDFLMNIREDIGVDLFHDILELRLIDMAFFVKVVKSVVFNEGRDEDEFIGIDDVRLDRRIKESHLHQEGFWGDVKLVGVHGVELENYDDLWRTIEIVSGLNETEAQERASQIHTLIENSSISFDHPIFSMNAVSVADFDMILLGEGLFHFFEEREIGDGGPLYAHAHEYGHTLQVQKGIPMTPFNTTAKNSRYSELMGDAIAAYYLVHTRGERLNDEDVKDMIETAFSVGDCAVNSDGHHGTPAQRACAAIWGASQSFADDSNTGTIVVGSVESSLAPVSSANDFVAGFDDALEHILSLNNETCHFPLTAGKTKSSSKGSKGSSKVSKGAAGRKGRMNKGRRLGGTLLL